ncbi:MAG: PAS domain S-box protein [Spirochaetes bacterium]|nr:PAS domain S-box protein [Spirochaetota bacterium]
MRIYLPRKLPTVVVLLIIVLFANGGPLSAEAPLVVNESLGAESLSGQMDYCTDASGLLGYGDINSPGMNGCFRRVSGGDPNFGYSREVYWFRFRTLNRGERPAVWYLKIDYPLLDSIVLFAPSPGGVTHIAAGDTLDFDARPLRYRSFVFPVSQPPGESTYFLRVQSRGAISVPAVIMSPGRFNDSMETESLLLWIHYGILLALSFYNTFIYISTRERNYLNLTMFIISIGMMSMVNNGLAFQYLWPHTPVWGNLSQPCILFITILIAIDFSRSFLNIPQESPRWNRVFLALSIIQGAGAASVFLMQYRDSARISALMVPITGSLLILYGLYSLHRRQREAIIYMAAWSLFIVGGVLFSLRGFALIPRTFFTEWSYMIGSTLLVLLFSFGVADKINFMRRERDRVQRALKESEERYRTLVENAHEGILLIVGRRARYANRALMNMTGYTEKEFYSLDLFSSLFAEPQPGRETVERIYTERMAGAAVPQKYEAQCVSKRGDIIDVIISAAVIEVEGKSGSLSVITNITEQKKAEKKILQQIEEIQSQYSEMEALNEELISTQEELTKASMRINGEKERLDTTLRSIADAVVAIDGEGRITLLNAVAERMIGRTIAEAGGMHFTEAVSVTDRQGQTVDPLAEMRERSTRPSRVLTLRGSDGFERSVEMQCSFLKAGSIEEGAVLVIRDITERLKLEQEVLKVSKIESLGILAGGIAHDFNNLLTAIIGNVSMGLDMAGDNRELAELLAGIQRAGRRATNLTHQLLTFSRGGAPIKQAASIIDLIEESAGFVLSGSKVTCQIEAGTDIPPLDIDVNQISQALNNVIINAMQEMQDGGAIRIDVERVAGLPANIPLETGEYVKITIADSGPGIPPEHLEKVFDPYFSTKEGGYGLGLTSTFFIVKRHGGHIEVTSEPGRGSVFTIYLKASAGAIPETEAPASPGVIRGGRVLIMDDEKQVIKTMESMLRHLGFQVTASSRGEEALEIYRDAMERGESFAAVIMDLTVPGGMGGIEAIKRLRGIDPDVAAIVSSGYSNDPVMSHYGDFGFNGVLAKPFTLQELSAVLITVLQRHPEIPQK